MKTIKIPLTIKVLFIGLWQPWSLSERREGQSSAIPETLSATATGNTRPLSGLLGFLVQTGSGSSRFNRPEKKGNVRRGERRDRRKEVLPGTQLMSSEKRAILFNCPRKDKLLTQHWPHGRGACVLHWRVHWLSLLA